MAVGRKYDVEKESVKLFGEDFKPVLRRFRKTPEYLKILNDKMNDLKVQVKEMSLQILHFYHGKMAQRVNEIVGVNNKTEPVTTTTPNPENPNLRRQGDKAEDAEEEEKNGIKKLDEYKIFHYFLTVAERNSFKDLGFEFAGDLIKSIIDNMGTTPETAMKTTHHKVGDHAHTTTTHAPHEKHVHQESLDSPTMAPPSD